MKKEWLLLTGVVTVTTILALAIVRWMAPQLLGLPLDLEVVQVSKKIPPFYENVFRREDAQPKEFLLKDPYTSVRGIPLFPEIEGWGPNDILGFRNRSVPDVADVITIGDSQTYGNNAVMADNWPSQMGQLLHDRSNVVYNMSTGGWAAIQYLDMFTNATLFQPHVVVVAFYTGNDPLESFRDAYSINRWEPFRLDPSISINDMPKWTFPPPPSEIWNVKFRDGIKTGFSPRMRLITNEDHPAVHAGYAIMREVARQISLMAKPRHVQVVFTIIPTKELVYAKKVQQEGLRAPKDYVELIAAEERNIASLSGVLKQLPDAIYVDLVPALQDAALRHVPLYPDDVNGHPIKEGYQVIAKVLAPVVNAHLPPRPQGLVAIRYVKEGYTLALVRGEDVWYFASTTVAAANGWKPGKVQVVNPRDVATLRVRGIINDVVPGRFGPFRR